MKKYLSILVRVIAIIVSPILVINIYSKMPLIIGDATYKKNLNKDDTRTINFNIKGVSIFNTECSIDNGKTWKTPIFDTCSYDLKSGDYTLLVKNKFKKTKKNFKVDINEVKKINLRANLYHLAPGEKFKISPEVDFIGDGKYTLTYKSDNEEIASVDENGVIEGKKVGEANILVEANNGVNSKIKIKVTDLIVKPVFNLKKKYLPCKAYSKEEAKELDEILFERVNYAKPGTRAAAIETARFLTLSFRYKVHYFFENGRLDKNSGIRYADGEGRYYHKGLYLSEDKFKEIDKKGIYAGPAIWGCGLTNYDTEYGWIKGKKYDNGLDCSGFVTWALYNSGLDVGDIGAGIKEGVKEMSDIGEMHDLTYEYANSGDYKVGDIIARWGHTAIIAGKDDEYIYIAESLLRGVRMEKYSYKKKNSGLYKYYTYINKMDKVYSEDGEYEDMWD